MQTALELVQNIDSFCIYRSLFNSYYINEVIKDLASDYRFGLLDTDTFISKLTAKTELYLKE